MPAAKLRFRAEFRANSSLPAHYKTALSSEWLNGKTECPQVRGPRSEESRSEQHPAGGGLRVGVGAPRERAGAGSPPALKNADAVEGDPIALSSNRRTAIRLRRGGGPHVQQGRRAHSPGRTPRATHGKSQVARGTWHVARRTSHVARDVRAIEADLVTALEARGVRVDHQIGDDAQTVRGDPAGATVVMASRRSGAAVQMTVSDEGPGTPTPNCRGCSSGSIGWTRRAHGASAILAAPASGWPSSSIWSNCMADGWRPRTARTAGRSSPSSSRGRALPARRDQRAPVSAMRR
jgi:hypothetical protein